MVHMVCSFLMDLKGCHTLFVWKASFYFHFCSCCCTVWSGEELAEAWFGEIKEWHCFVCPEQFGLGDFREVESLKECHPLEEGKGQVFLESLSVRQNVPSSGTNNRLGLKEQRCYRAQMNIFFVSRSLQCEIWGKPKEVATASLYY